MSLRAYGRSNILIFSDDNKYLYSASLDGGCASGILPQEQAQILKQVRTGSFQLIYHRTENILQGSILMQGNCLEY